MPPSKGVLAAAGLGVEDVVVRALKHAVVPVGSWQRRSSRTSSNSGNRCAAFTTLPGTLLFAVTCVVAAEGSRHGSGVHLTRCEDAV